MKIFISTALTHVPREAFESYSELIHAIAAALSNNGHSVQYAFIDSDPQLSQIPRANKATRCYKWDRSLVENADLVIGEMTYPSVGVGIELQIADFLKIPIVMICSQYNTVNPVKYQNPDGKTYDLQIGDGHISLMALGIPSVIDILLYEDTHSLPGEVTQLVERISNGASRQ